MFRRLIAAILVVLVGLFTPGLMAHFQQPALAAGAPRTVYVNLFEWRWADVARECETYLGPKGFAAVQVSPPHEHVHDTLLAGNGTNYAFPWWERYQVISYAINSRSGNRAEFQNMVQRCNAVGVNIYVDAVINHMAGEWVGKKSFSGTTSWSHYNYPGVPYTNNNFHHCNPPVIAGSDYKNDPWRVQHCELVKLADLATEDTSYVRPRIQAYLNDLLSLGVDGFRIDAAKHIPPADLTAILSGLKRVPEGDTPQVIQEVIEGNGEPIQGSDYFNTTQYSSLVNEFQYGQEMKRILTSGRLKELFFFNSSKPGFMPSDKATVFIDNHDTQRNGSTLSYKDGNKYVLANVLMLAWPYGYPQLMSGYAFTDKEVGPPGSGGVTSAIYSSPTDTTPDCSGGWLCEHRYTAIGNMVAFRNYTQSGTSQISTWVPAYNNYNEVAFGIGINGIDRGFVVANGENFGFAQTFQTSMPAGTYCNVIDGQLNASGTGCTGTTITVDANGSFSAWVNAMSAIAIHGGQKVTAPAPISVTFAVSSVPINTGEKVYLVGNRSELGNWNPCNGLLLSSMPSSSTWIGSVSLPASTPIEFKFVKWAGTCQNAQWETFPNNRKLTTPATGGYNYFEYRWNQP